MPRGSQGYTSSKKNGFDNILEIEQTIKDSNLEKALLKVNALVEKEQEIKFNTSKNGKISFE